jgi:hypothetical protein
MKKLFVLKLCSILFLFSCENESLEIISQASDGEFLGELVEGRLHFNNEQEFKTSIEYVKSLEDIDVEILMYRFYDKGFVPLYPFYQEDDVTKILEFVAKKKKRLGLTSEQVLYRTTNDEVDDDGEVLEQDDDLIGDDYFAALLNFDREIVVDGKLHKYTNEGVFRVDLDKKTDLDTYIIENNITELSTPDPTTLERGLVNVTPTVERYAPQSLSDQCGNETVGIASVPEEQSGGFYNELVLYNDECDNLGGGSSSGGSSSGGSSSGGSSSSPTDHTASMTNYIKDLTPCNTQSGGIFGWNPFGTSRKCFENFSSRYRTKTKYWNESYLIYASIGVKVKHQKKNLWWGAKTTNEAAIVVNQAVFSAEAPFQIPSYASFPIFSSRENRLLFFDGKFYPDVESYYVIQGWTPPHKLKPDTPFSDDIIIQEHIDLPILRNIDDIEIEARELNKLFWEKGVYSGAKNLMNQLRGEDPRRITYLVTTPQKSYIHYVDLTNRKLNTKKIIDKFDESWGGSIGFTFKLGTGGEPSIMETYNEDNGEWVYTYDTPNVWNTGSSSVRVKFDGLTEYETISMDFVGLTRKGDTWKGDRIVYERE